MTEREKRIIDAIIESQNMRSDIALLRAIAGIVAIAFVAIVAVVLAIVMVII